jgi:hypothetical protein
MDQRVLSFGSDGLAKLPEFSAVDPDGTGTIPANSGWLMENGAAVSTLFSP